MQYQIFNLFVCLFGVLMTSILLLSRPAWDRSREQRAFVRIIQSMGIYSFLYMIAQIVEMADFPGATQANALCSVVIHMAQVTLGFNWYLCFDATVLGHQKRSLGWYLLATLPCNIMAILLVVNLHGVFGHFLYFFNEQGIYVRGPYYGIILLLTYLYLALVGVMALGIMCTNPSPVIRGQAKTVLTYVTGPTLFSIAHAAYEGMSLQILGIVLSTVYMYIQLQGERITQDYLTRLNNRGCMEKYLTGRIANYDNNPHETRQLYLMMMDLNGFKQVNDTLGHVEGDRALCLLADTLRTNAAPGVFLSRYGGDEFVIVAELPDDATAMAYAEHLYEAAWSIDTGKDYHLCLSIGWARYQRKEGAERLLRRADAAMYRDKERLRAGR